MDKDFIVSCPYCGHANEFNLEDYADNYESDISTRCDLCGNPFIFELEINVLSHTFKD